MTLRPYTHYAGLGDEKAYQRWESHMKFFVALSALAGIGVVLFFAREIPYAVFGAMGGGAVGYGNFRWVVYASATSTADELYTWD